VYFNANHFRRHIVIYKGYERDDENFAVLGRQKNCYYKAVWKIWFWYRKNEMILWYGYIIPLIVLKAYKWIWGQEDCNYPPPKYKGRAMSWEGWEKIGEKWAKTGDGIEDLRDRLKNVI